MSSSNNVILKVKELTKVFSSGRRKVIAVDHVSFDIHKGEIVSLVGQSGSGKTTTAHMILNLLKPTSGNIVFEDKDIKYVNKRAYWQNVQGIFQDPFSSFNQFFVVKKVLRDTFKILDKGFNNKEKDRIIVKALEDVNIDPDDVLEKYPFELSGGQMQRIMIARIFIIKPKLVIADEPTSMIDSILRANILELFEKLRNIQGTSIMFITHDIGLAYYVSDRIFIMHNGKIVEEGDAEQVIMNPNHPYTKGLIEDVPTLHKEWLLTKGS